MTPSSSPRDEPQPRLGTGGSRRAGARPARWAWALLAGLALMQLAGCAARLWPPSEWSLSVDLPKVQAAETVPAPEPAPTPQPAVVPAAPLKDPTNVTEALAYAEALCALPPAELDAEIERLRTLHAQDGDAPLRARQLAFAQQLAQLYAEQERLQESNERQAQLLRERQRRIEQLNGQIEAMRAVEYSLPAANPSAVTTPTASTSPVAPFPATAPASAGRPSAAGSPSATPKTVPASKSPATNRGDRGGGDTPGKPADTAEDELKVGEDAPPAPSKH